MWMHPHTIKLMETNTNDTEAKQPASAGCIARLVRFYCPSLVMTRGESIETIKNLQRKLNESRADTKEWRNRAISAERIITYAIPTAIKTSVEDHDTKHGTYLGWRL
jgi:hypothetical protein